jgi:hypothetical protein
VDFSLIPSESAIWWARGLALLHAGVVAVTVAGGVALFTGRFRAFHLGDYFAWTFFACCVGQLISLVLTGGCIFTSWEREMLAIAGQRHSYTGTFLQRLFPWLPDEFVSQGVPLLTLGALMGAVIQASLALKRRRTQ